MKINIRLLLLLTLLFITGCGTEVQNENTVTSLPVSLTATLHPTPSSQHSETQPPPPPQPMVAPVEGNTSTPLNVRAEPSTASEVIGIIPANSSVQIVGKDIGENWWQIIYEAGVDGRGWVSAQYIETAGKPEVPVVRDSESNSQLGSGAVVIQQLNIRSGPGTGFNSLGVLNTNDVISLTGKNRDGTWLQIEYSEGPEGRGWINSAFVKTEALESLPIVSDLGEVIGTEIPPAPLLPPTPTIVPAPLDFDTADTPIRTVTFNRTEANAFIYSGDVSSPNGDLEDWIAFIPYNDVVFVDIQCIGGNSILTEINNPKTALLCDQPSTAVTVPVGSETLIHIRANSSSDQLQYVRYIITIRANP